LRSHNGRSTGILAVWAWYAFARRHTYLLLNGISTGLASSFQFSAGMPIERLILNIKILEESHNE
jgi:hypothetical protein